jgi:anti-sigma regulatory factor (Ser/Thr protein kinase)
MSGRDLTAGGPADVVRGLTSDGTALRDVAGLSHAALLYDGRDGDLEAGAAVAGRATDAAAPLHVVVTAPTMDWVRAAVTRAAPTTVLVDMADLGRNPARIIPSGQSFADEHPGEHVYCLWEPAWPARSAAELLEVARHETLCNVAFSGRPMTIVCLYDTARLPAEVISDAERTHPVVVASGAQHSSPGYLGPGRFPPGTDDPLPPVDQHAVSVTFEGRLGPVRDFCASQAQAAGLPPARVSDMVLAVSEIAANALGHAAGGGIVRSWCTTDEMVCQVEDRGHIADPLAGRRRQPADARGGHGLWLVNRVCDLVERRTGPAGTITRLHIKRTARA